MRVIKIPNNAYYNNSKEYYDFDMNLLSVVDRNIPLTDIEEFNEWSEGFDSLIDKEGWHSSLYTYISEIFPYWNKRHLLAKHISQSTKYNDSLLNTVISLDKDLLLDLVNSYMRYKKKKIVKHIRASVSNLYNMNRGEFTFVYNLNDNEWKDTSDLFIIYHVLHYLRWVIIELSKRLEGKERIFFTIGQDNKNKGIKGVLGVL